jgi:thiol-disulfide isomerase/thioredoxin
MQIKNRVMKQSFFFASIVTLFFACNQTNPKLTISGQITNPTSEEVSFRFSDTTVTVSVDSSGVFLLDVSLDSPQYVRFTHNPERSEIYLMPNSELTLTLNTEQFDETLMLEGTNAAPSNYLLELYLLDEKMPRAYDRAGDDPLKFAEFIDSVATAKTELLLSNKQNLPVQFYELIYEKISNASNYVSSWSYKGKIDSIPDRFFDYRKELDFNRADLVGIRSYMDAIETEATIGLESSLDWNNPESRLNYFNSIIDRADSLIENEKVLNVLLKNHIGLYKSYVDIEQVESRLDEYQAIFEKQEYKELKDAIAKIKALVPGSEVPDFEFTSLEDEQVLLSDFRGDLIYIDLWATWCGPCIREQPYMEELVKEFANKNVTFLAISTDSSPKPWKKMVADRSLSGTHVYAKGAWKADIMTHFVVEGIPRYILLDTEGKIIDRNAPRPSGNIDEVLREQLELM